MHVLGGSIGGGGGGGAGAGDCRRDVMCHMRHLGNYTGL